MCAYKPPPRDLPWLPNAERKKPKTLINRNGRKKRKRWVDPDGYIYEWDYQHGTVEKYDKQGNHLGELDPKDGMKRGPAIPNRRIVP